MSFLRFKHRVAFKSVKRHLFRIIMFTFLAILLYFVMSDSMGFRFIHSYPRMNMSTALKSICPDMYASLFPRNPDCCSLYPNVYFTCVGTAGGLCNQRNAVNFTFIGRINFIGDQLYPRCNGSRDESSLADIFITG